MLSQIPNIYALHPHIKVFGTTSRYIQGPGVIKELGKILREYGIRKPLVFADEIVTNIITKHGLFSALESEGIEFVKELFGRTPCGPESCDEEIDRLAEIAKANECDAVVGAGGGKAIDTAKAVAAKLGIPVVIVPTIASTDAPCSSLSVIYTCEHVFKEYRFYPKSPDIVVVDTKIIAESPPRFLACGIGDAMGKYTEVPSSLRVGAYNLLVRPIRGSAPLLALAAQKLMIDILLTYGEEAIESVERGVVTPALEAVVEAVTLLSQVAFECGGLAGAHSIYNGFTALEPKYKHKFPYHGELVFFGMLTEMVMDGYPRSELIELMKFGHSVGLPINLEELGFSGISDDELMEVATRATAPGETIHNKPYKVTPELVFNSMKVANELGLEVAERCPRRKFKR